MRINGFEKHSVGDYTIDRDTVVERHNYGEVMSQSLWSRYDRHFVGITLYNALSSIAKIYRVIQIKLDQLISLRKMPI